MIPYFPFVDKSQIGGTLTFGHGIVFGLVLGLVVGIIVLLKGKSK